MTSEGGFGEIGRFVNPDNSAFQVALNSKIYMDKTGLLEYTNSVLGTSNAYICNSSSISTINSNVYGYMDVLCILIIIICFSFCYCTYHFSSN